MPEENSMTLMPFGPFEGSPIFFLDDSYLAQVLAETNATTGLKRAIVRELAVRYGPPEYLEAAVKAVQELFLPIDLVEEANQWIKAHPSGGTLPAGAIVPQKHKGGKVAQ